MKSLLKEAEENYEKQESHIQELNQEHQKACKNYQHQISKLEHKAEDVKKK